MNTPLVSIGLPVVKVAFLKNSIECCLSQSYTNFELIIINNAFSITQKQQIKDLVSEFIDERISYYENEIQIPMVPNWNLTLSKSTGDFFALLCDDDYWAPNFIENILKVAEKFPEPSIFHCRVAQINSNNELMSITPNCPEFESGLDFIYHRLINHRTFYLSDFIVKRDDLSRIGGFVDFVDGWGSDTFTWFLLSIKGGIGYSPELLFYYRVSDINVTNSGKLKNKFLAINQHFQFFGHLFNLISQKNDEFEIVAINQVRQEIKMYVPFNRKVLVYSLLVGKFHCPRFIASFLSSVYRFLLESKVKMRSKN